MSKMPLVSIVVVTYNSASYIEQCLKSLRQLRYSHLELLIVDNHSTDATVAITKRVTRHWPYPVTLITSTTNLGYAVANNQLIHQAKGEFVFVLNPDTLVVPTTLTPLVTTLQRNPSLAAAQPVVYLLHQPAVLNLTGKITHYLGLDWLRDYQAEHVSPNSQLTSISGSGVLLRKNVFETAGGFDDQYFMYHEDSDLSWRLRLMGYHLECVSKSLMYHDYRFVTDASYQSFATKFYFAERNRLVTILKNYSWRTLWLISPVALLLEIALVGYALTQGLGRQKLRTYLGVWQLRRHILTQHHRVQQLRVQSDRELVSSFASVINFKEFEHPVLRWLINPILHTYWWLVKRFI